MKKILTEKVKLANGNKLLVIYYKGSGDPVLKIEKFIQKNIKNKFYYTEFIDSNMDNPWVRILAINKDSNNTNRVIY